MAEELLPSRMPKVTWECYLHPNRKKESENLHSHSFLRLSESEGHKAAWSVEFQRWQAPSASEHMNFIQEQEAAP